MPKLGVSAKTGNIRRVANSIGNKLRLISNWTKCRFYHFQEGDFQAHFGMKNHRCFVYVLLNIFKIFI